MAQGVVFAPCRDLVTCSGWFFFRLPLSDLYVRLAVLVDSTRLRVADVWELATACLKHHPTTNRPTRLFLRFPSIHTISKNYTNNQTFCRQRILEVYQD